MKQILLLLLSVCLAMAALAQSVGIGTPAPHGSALVELSSTNKGLLAPRMTTVQRTAIASPAKGLLVYDTDLNALYHYNGSAWAAVGGGGGSFNLPFEATTNLNSDIFKITNGGTGDAIKGITTNEFGRAVAGIANSASGYGIYGYTNGAEAVAVYGDAGNGTAVKGHSVGGLGVDARSTNNSAVKATILLGANNKPVIEATHAGIGTALFGKSATGYGLEVEGKVKISGGNTSPSSGAVLTSDASGNAVWGSTIAFKAAGTDDVDGVSIPLNTWYRPAFKTDIKYNLGAAWQTNNSQFVAPAKGIYHFDAHVQVATSSSFSVRIERNRGGVLTNLGQSNFLNAGTIPLMLSVDADLLPGDIVYMALYRNGSALINSSEETYYLSGHLVSRY